MSKRYTTQKEHDAVVIESARAYDAFKVQGYLVSINVTEHPCHDVGNSNYPDVVVWKPGGDYGDIEIIEEIETSETVNLNAAKKWKKYCTFSRVFFLIVPKKYISLAAKIVKSENIGISMIQYYEINSNSEISFFDPRGVKLWPRSQLKSPVANS